MKKKVAIMGEEARRALTPILEEFDIRVTNEPGDMMMVSVSDNAPIDYLYIGLAPVLRLNNLSVNQAAHAIVGAVAGVYSNQGMRKPVKGISK